MAIVQVKTGKRVTSCLLDDEAETGRIVWRTAQMTRAADPRFGLQTLPID
jgi:hypothetical protein